MTKLIDALQNLAVTLGCAETKSAVASGTVDEVINFIADNLPEPKVTTGQSDA